MDHEALARCRAQIPGSPRSGVDKTRIGNLQRGCHLHVPGQLNSSICAYVSCLVSGLGSWLQYGRTPKQFRRARVPCYSSLWHSMRVITDRCGDRNKQGNQNGWQAEKWPDEGTATTPRKQLITSQDTIRRAAGSLTQSTTPKDKRDAGLAEGPRGWGQAKGPDKSGRSIARAGQEDCADVRSSK